ncbi:hypothetical protein [Pseudomonas sp. NFACC07-1]|uniref:hypothetical protein n=1 Tax=Pseudomonas sp. NFACC07-1 TaxID=1566239 RepID=UPI0008B40FD7|nr:hypothetical protein [Pseudomonas sp. NFACC07-1]SEI69607.1 hypothetical protein SAMN03159298_01089 [Pseudomonas sp. NFACC07-1]
MHITQYTQESLSLLKPFVAPLAIVREDALSNDQFALVEAVDAFQAAFEDASEALAKDCPDTILEACMDAVSDTLELLTGQMSCFNVNTRVATSSRVIFDNTQITKSAVAR